MKRSALCTNLRESKRRKLSSSDTLKDVPKLLPAILRNEIKDVWPKLNTTVEILTDTNNSIPISLVRIFDKNFSTSKALAGLLKAYKATKWHSPQIAFKCSESLTLDKLDLSFNNDIFNQKHLYMLHLASKDWTTDFHHDLGLQTYCSVLHGEKRFQIWSQEKTFRHFVCGQSLSDPDWEFILKPGKTLYIPAGCGHLVTTLSECAIMSTGSFLTASNFLTGWLFNQFVDAEYNLDNVKDFNELWNKVLPEKKQSFFENAQTLRKQCDPFLHWKFDVWDYIKKRILSTS